MNREILSLSAAGSYLAVLYMDTLTVYTEELEVYAQLEGTGGRPFGADAGRRLCSAPLVTKRPPLPALSGKP